MGPGGPHHGMGAGGDDMIGQLIARTRAQLNLNTSQAAMFDAAICAPVAAHGAGLEVLADGYFPQSYHLWEWLYSGSSGFTLMGYDDTPNNGGDCRHGPGTPGRKRLGYTQAGDPGSY